MSPQVPLTISIINNELNKKFGVKNRKKAQTDVKNKLDFSYKKGGSITLKDESK